MKLRAFVRRFPSQCETDIIISSDAGANRQELRSGE